MVAKADAIWRPRSSIYHRTTTLILYSSRDLETLQMDSSFHKYENATQHSIVNFQVVILAKVWPSCLTPAAFHSGFVEGSPTRIALAACTPIDNTDCSANGSRM